VKEKLKSIYPDRIDEIDDIGNKNASTNWQYPFIRHERFVHFIQNKVERKRAYDQRSVWIQKHSKFSLMSEDELTSVLNAGGSELNELLGSMQSFNANLPGSNQYLFQKRILLEKLCEQHGLCTVWFTLSMADNHWDDLHSMLNRDKGGNVLNPMPTFDTFKEEAAWKRKCVRENPHLVDAYFYEKVPILFQGNV
jgi:hypothetical protein